MPPAIELPASGSAPAAVQLGETGEAGKTTDKTGMWVFLAADSMGFAGLLAAHSALRARAPAGASGERLAPTLALALTLLLVASSGTLAAAVMAVEKSRARRGRLWLMATVALGAAFIAGQGFEFRALLGASASHFSTRAPPAALFFVLTGYHGLHVLAGLGVLSRLAFRVRRPTADVLTIAALYWQFVDVVWLVLFAALYLLPAVSHV